VGAAADALEEVAIQDGGIDGDDSDGA
jgi:hypothetical protein